MLAKGLLQDKIQGFTIGETVLKHNIDKYKLYTCDPDFSNIDKQKIIEIMPTYVKFNSGNCLCDNFTLHKDNKWLPVRTWGYRFNEQRFVANFYAWLGKHSTIYTGIYKCYKFIKTLYSGTKTVFWLAFHYNEYKSFKLRYSHYPWTIKKYILSRSQTNSYYFENTVLVKFSKSICKVIKSGYFLINTFYWYKLKMPWKIA